MKLPIQAHPIARNTSDTKLRDVLAVIPQVDVCVGAEVHNGQVCANLPIVGRECIPVPGLPELGQVDVCCTPYVFPPHVQCCVRYNGSDVICESLP